MVTDEMLALARFTRLDSRNCDEAAKDRLLSEMADEIERLTFIQREFYNLDDVVEIRRLRALIRRVIEWEPALPAEASLLDELAAAVPALDVKPPHPDTFHRAGCPWLEDREADCTCDDVPDFNESGGADTGSAGSSPEPRRDGGVGTRDSETPPAQSAPTRG